MDFFTVPTLTFGVLYCFFVIGHDRRKILRFNVTRNPSALWTVQQIPRSVTIPESLAVDLLELTVSCRYLESLLQNARIRQYLNKHRLIVIQRVEGLLAQFNACASSRRSPPC